MTVLVDEAKNSGSYTPTIQEQFTQAKNLWLDENYEGVLPIAVEITKDLLPIIIVKGSSPSFSVYLLNAKAVDQIGYHHLGWPPVTVSFEK